MLALLFAAVLAQQPTLADLEFSMAVEASIQAERGTAPPEPYAGLIARLGSECWTCREIASRKLQRLSADDQRWLFWGRASRDLEIRLRCNVILRKLNPCPSCDGTGESKNYSGYPCFDCDGLKTIWLWSPWD